MEEKKQRRKSFLNGLVAGICITLISIILIDMITGFPMSAKNSKMELIEELVDRNYLFGTEGEYEIEDSTYKAYIESLGDPYSQYFTEAEFEAYTQDLSGEFGGVGIVFRQVELSGKTVSEVVSVNEDSPAEKAGVGKGDVLISVDGKNVIGASMNEAVSMVRGEIGTEVSLEFIRSGKDEKYTVNMERVEIRTDSVMGRMLEENIGYMAVTAFNTDTEEDFRDTLNQLLKKGMTGLVIDLRGNPGGLVDECTGMLDRLLPEGILVTSEFKDGTKEEHRSDNKESLDMPMAVLVDGGSASASEIFAGAMQDFGKAEIIGTKTYGKGIIQQIYPLTDGSAVKLTVAEYLTPSGKHIHEKGLEPDIKVEDTRKTAFDENDDQLEKAKDYITSAR